MGGVHRVHKKFQNKLVTSKLRLTGGWTCKQSGLGGGEREITIGMAYNWPFKLHFCFSVRFRAICGGKNGCLFVYKRKEFNSHQYSHKQYESKISLNEIRNVTQ